MKNGGANYYVGQRTLSSGRAIFGAGLARICSRWMFHFSNQSFPSRAVIFILLIFPLIALMGCATALTGAAARGDLGEVKKLLASGVDLNERDDNGFTALGAAAYQGKTNIVKFLVERGADVNFRHTMSGSDLEGSTPLHFASYRGRVDTVRTLIELGADVNARNKHNWTPLHLAVYESHSETVRLLVEAGSDLNIQAYRIVLFSGGGTALQLARGHKDIENILLEAQKEKSAKRYAKIEPSSTQPLSPPAVEKDAPKDLPKIAVWDLLAGNIPATYAQDLTAILVSEIARLKKYEVYTQENIRTIAGWTAEKMKLGCTDTKCLLTLGQMDINSLISGRVGKIGDTYTISLNLFDTQNARAENAVSDFCRSENELIGLIQRTALKLLKSAN